MNSDSFVKLNNDTNTPAQDVNKNESRSHMESISPYYKHIFSADNIIDKKELKSPIKII